MDTIPYGYGDAMLKNENAIEFAKRIGNKKDDGTDQSFLEEEEFDEILRTMLKTSVQGWSGFVSRLKPPSSYHYYHNHHHITTIITIIISLLS